MTASPLRRRSLRWLPRSTWLPAVLSLVLWTPAAATQDPPPQGGAPTAPATQEPVRASSTEALHNLATRIQIKVDEVVKAEQTLEEKDQKVEEAVGGNRAVRSAAVAEQRDAELALADQRKQLADLRRQFESMASGIEVQEIGDADAQFNLNDEVVSVLRPVIDQLKKATEGPREIERLRTRLELVRDQRALVEQALRRVQLRIDDPQSADFAAQLATAKQSLENRLRGLRDSEAVTLQQKEQRESQQRSLFESGTEVLSDFFRNRGLNLAIGIGTLLLVAFGLRFLGRSLGLTKSRRSRPSSIYGRLASVLFGAFVAVASVGAMLIAFYAANDWLLLLLTLVFLLGMGWASLRMLPVFFEHMRLLLNLGSVREGERIMFQGLPWKVDRLKVYTQLINPKLTGGLMRLPIKDLAGFHSRPIGADEVWFPTSRGDWVLLDDGSRWQVMMQSPDLVQLKEIGGAHLTCRTEDFLAMKARNLSHDFAVGLTFGVDYAHQAVVTRQIPGLVQSRVREELRTMVGPDNLIDLRVEFKEASASSLDLLILAQCRGAVARDYARIQRAMSRVMVDACTEHGWTIPFTQVTLHQASQAS